MRGRLITAFLLVFAAIFFVAHAGRTSLGDNNGEQQQPMFSSEQIAKSKIRQRAQEKILSNSRLGSDRRKSPGSPQSPQTPLSGGSGVASPGQQGSRLSPDLGARQLPRKPSTYLQDPPSPRGGVNPNAVPPTSTGTGNTRKPSCASLCQTVYEQPPRPVCILDSSLNEFVSLRNTAHIACYKCLNPNSRIEVRLNQKDCDEESPRRKRYIGQ